MPTRKMIRFGYIALVITLIAGIMHNIAGRNTVPKLPENTSDPVVVELFSSTLCPSCPQAEKKLSTLSEDPNIFALSCHVSTLDNSGIRDELATDFCLVRQHGYADFITERKIFTPFMVVNGEDGFVGTKTNLLAKALQKSAINPPKHIEINEEDDRFIAINLPQIQGEQLRLWAIGYNTENNKTGTDKETRTNVALTQDNLGAWDGTQQTRRMQILSSGVKDMLIIAQEHGYGKIRGIGRIHLK